MDPPRSETVSDIVPRVTADDTDDGDVSVSVGAEHTTRGLR
jgi:hypothetical protein